MKYFTCAAASMFLFLFADGQDVGIGTATPATRLHVLSSGAIPLYVESSSANSSQMGFYVGGNLKGYAGAYGGDMEFVSAAGIPIHIGAGFGHHISILSLGWVGIGTETPREKMEIFSGNLRLSGTNKGIMLNAADRPFITRAFDTCTSGIYSGLGRWGLFMEPNRLTFGIPNLAGKAVEFARYELNSTKTTLLTVNEQGNMQRPATNNQDLLPVAMGNINYNGAVWGGTGNFTVEHPSTGTYYLTFSGFTYSDQQYIVEATMATTFNTPSYVYTDQTTDGRLVFLVRTPAGGFADQNVHFVMYKL